MKVYNLIPAIRGEARILEGKYFFLENPGVSHGGFETWCTEAFFKRLGQPQGKDIGIYLIKNERIEEEGYSLVISEKQINIEAATERGVIWALTTILFLMEDNKVCCGQIYDNPKYVHRGVSMDCARHFFPVREVKRVIEEISLAKMNVFHWHLTDDQGWRIESRRFPKLHEKSGEYYTQEEIREVCEYAKLRGVEIVPEIEFPGHVSALLSAYPKYSCSQKEVEITTGGGIYPVILCPGNEDTFGFIEELMDEILPLFPGKRMHIGGDEAPKWEWKKCPRCQKRIKDLGYKDWEQLQGYFMTRVNEIIKSYNKTAICWNETLRSSEYPQDIQIQYWTLQHRNSMEKYAVKENEWIYSDMFELYLDYPYSMTPIKKVYETIPRLGEKDVSEWKGLLGIECCLWSEHITECFRVEELLFPRVYSLAEISWNGAGDYKEFEKRLESNIKSKWHGDIHYTDKNWWNPKGQERQREAFSYMAKLNAGMSEEVRKQTVESTAPNEEFGRAFMTKFFQPEDMAVLMKNEENT